MRITTHITEATLAEAVDLIITTRDFCGNEREAVLEFARECGLNRTLAEQLLKRAAFQANARWNTFKKAAGVNPKWIF